MSPFVRIYLGRVVYIGHVVTLALALAAMALSHGCTAGDPEPATASVPANVGIGLGGFR